MWKDIKNKDKTFEIFSSKKRNLEAGQLLTNQVLEENN